MVWASMSFAEEVQPTKVYLLRHAETVDDGTHDPALSDVGETRAQKWAALLAPESIDMIYSTDYKRTQETAQAIAATREGLTITSYDPRALDLEELWAEIVGKTVVIVGHSNTTPLVCNGLLGTEKFEALAHEDYGTLYIVHCLAEDQASVTELQLD